MLCNHPHPDPTRAERCLMPEGVPHEGRHNYVDGENLNPSFFPAVHAPVSGWPAEVMDIQHLSGECIWCDGERWRKVVASCEAAGIEIEPGWMDPSAMIVE